MIFPVQLWWVSCLLLLARLFVESTKYQACSSVVSTSMKFNRSATTGLIMIFALVYFRFCGFFDIEKDSVACRISWARHLCSRTTFSTTFLIVSCCIFWVQVLPHRNLVLRSVPDLLTTLCLFCIYWFCMLQDCHAHINYSISNCLQFSKCVSLSWRDIVKQVLVGLRVFCACVKYLPLGRYFSNWEYSDVFRRPTVHSTYQYFPCGMCSIVLFSIVEGFIIRCTSDTVVLKRDSTMCSCSEDLD